MATPGRFLHVMMEMDLKLTAVEYVVFDEADRYESSSRMLTVINVHFVRAVVLKYCISLINYCQV